MKVTKERSAQNRAALISAASKLFRERGIDGVGVADISNEAGLTHGALYAQFSSKEELAAEALAHGMSEMLSRARARGGEDGTLADSLRIYLRKKHRDSLATGCPLAASGSEVARQDKAVSRSFTDGFSQMAEELEPKLGTASSSPRERALAIAAAEIGALIVARSVAKADPRLSEEVLSAARRVLTDLDGHKRSKRRAKSAVRQLSSAHSKLRRY